MPRDLRLLAGAVFLSAAGDLLALIVLALQVHALTGSGLAVSALVATTLVPLIALAPAAGLVTDRCESVRVLVVASLAQAAAAAALAFTGDLTAILAFSALLAAGNALGPRPALLANAATFLAIAAAGALRARRPPSPGAGEPARALDGVRLLRGDRVLRITLAAAVAALLFIAAALTVELFYVKDVVGASDAGYAVVVGGWMVGMVLGALAPSGRIPVRLVAAAALAALAVQGAGMGLQAVWAILPVACAGYLVGGAGHGVKNVLLRALIAVRVPAAVHGRAFAAYNAARSAAELCALGAGGVLIGALGPRAALVLAGLGPVVAAAAGATALRASH